MNRRAIVYQWLVFATQWGLMVVGFGLLSTQIAPADILKLGSQYDRYLNAAIKAVVALLMSTLWLVVWDRQIRILFYRRIRETTIE